MSWLYMLILLLIIYWFNKFENKETKQNKI